MRGQRIYNEIIKGDIQGKINRKGRNDKLVIKRNECLLARYVFLGLKKDHCYEEIVRALVSEFFLSPNTIVKILQENTDMLHTIRQRAQVTYYFQNKWPHLRW